MSQYPWTLLAVYVVTTGSVQLLALWAAYSPRPWLLRALVVWTPIALLATIRAYEPAILLLMSAALTIGICLTVERYWPRVPSDKPRLPLWRFRLADLLVVMLFVATWFALVGRGNGSPWAIFGSPFIVIALLLALLSIFAYRAVTGPKRVTMATLALGVVWVSAVLMRMLRSPLYLVGGSYQHGQTSMENEFYWLGAHAAVFTSTVICLAIAITAARSAQTPAREVWRKIGISISVLAVALLIPMAWLSWELFWVVPPSTWNNRAMEVAIHSIFFIALAGTVACAAALGRAGSNGTWPTLRHFARGTSLVLCGLIGVAGTWLYWHMLREVPYPNIDQRPVNHYDDLVTIAKSLRQFDFAKTLPADAQLQVDEAMVLLRSPNYRPLDARDPEFWGIQDESALRGSDIQSLSRRFKEAADAAASGNPDLAADYAVAIIRFEAMVNQGMVAYHANGGCQLLAKLRQDVSPKKAREIADLLHRTLLERYSAEQIAAWNHADALRTCNWQAKLRYVLATRGSAPDSSASAAWITETRKPSDTIVGLLQADLAVRAYRKENGTLPRTLDDLVPECLPEVPVDPYSLKTLIYQPGPRFKSSGPPTEHFLLYSVGLNGIDDGGKFPSKPPRPGEIDIDLKLESLLGM